MENNDFQSALDFTKEGLDTIREDMTAAMTREIRVAEDLVRTAAELGADTTKPANLIERARGDVTNLDFEKAKNALNQSRAESEKALQRSLDGRASDFSRIIQEARAIGADPSAAQEVFTRAESAIKKGSYQEGAQLAKQGFQAVQQAQFQRVVAVLGTSREKFAAAANMGVDLKGPFEDLNTAREAVRRGAFQEAIAHAKRADVAVDAILDRYRKVETRLKELHRSFAEVEGFGVQTVRARKFSEAARQAYQERNPAEVEKAVQSAFDELRRAERERVLEAIERAEFILTLGEQNAVDLSEPSKLLQEAIVATKSDDYRHALDLTTILQAKAERRLAELAARQISTLRTSLPHLGDESGSLKALVNRADASMASQDFEGAFKAVAEGQRLVESRVRTRAEEIVADLALAVRVGVDVGANVTALEALHRELNAYLGGGQVAEIVATRDKATAALAGITDALVSLVRGRIGAAQGLKIEVDDLNDLVRRARMAFGVQNYHEGLRLLNDGNERASKASAMHRQAYNAIATAAAFVAEAKKRNVDVSKVVEMLVDAKKAKDYDKALAFAQRTEDEFTALIKARLASSLMASEALLGSLEGVDLAGSSDTLVRARGHLEAGEVEQAAELSLQLKSQLDTRKRQGDETEAALRQIQDILADAEAMNAPLERTRALFESAERAHRLGQFDEALDIVAQADVEATKERDQTIAAMMKRFEESVLRAKKEGTDTRPAEKLFERAREFFRAKQYRQAIATALQSEAEAERISLQQAIAKQAVDSVEGKLRALGRGSELVVGFVADSRKAYSDGDYVNALDTSIHASDSIADLRVLLEEVADVREKARELLQVFADVGADATKFERSFQEGEAAFEIGEVERSRAAFTDGIEWGQNLLGAHLRDELAKGEALIDMCRKMDVDPTGAQNKFAEAKVQITSERFREAAAGIRAARDEASTALTAKLNRALQDAADNVAHAKKLGSDSRDAEALLRQANDRILHGEYDRAMDVVNNALERVESAKVIEKRFIDLTFKAETTIRNGRKFGIDMKAAEGKLAQAVQLRKSDFAEATRAAEEAYRIAWEATEAFAPSMRGFLDVVAARLNEWAAYNLTIWNGLIKKGFKLTRCGCGRDFHELCASRVGRCPVCFRGLQGASY